MFMGECPTLANFRSRVGYSATLAAKLINKLDLT